jgi:hypothetical protein
MSFAFRNGSCTDDLPPPDCHPVKGCGQRFFSRRIRPAAFEQNRLEPELLSYRAPPELHEPDNFSTFVSSPLIWLVPLSAVHPGSESDARGLSQGVSQGELRPAAEHL